MNALAQWFKRLLRIQFKYTNNPYRRNCVDCGVTQQFYTFAGQTIRHGWWECMDEGCIYCNRYARNDILPGW